MARPRRSGSGRSSFMAADWVYRDHVYDEAGAIIDDHGSYTNISSALTSGQPNALFKVLYDSHNYVKNVVALGAGLPGILGSSARAEGGKATIIASEGQFIIRPSTWALGSNVIVGYRIGVFEQDPGAGAALVDPTYTMFVSGANVSLNPASWANNRQWVRERRFYSSFNAETTGPVWVISYRWKGRRRLKPHEAFGIYMESNGQGGTVGSVAANVQFWCRTLVHDEG